MFITSRARGVVASLVLMSVLGSLGLALLLPGASSGGGKVGTDQALLALADQMNVRLAQEHAPVRVDTLEAFTIGSGRWTAVRLHQQDRRWVPNDPRRGGRTSLTYLIDPTFGHPYGPVTTAQSTQVFQAVIQTWKREARCLDNVPIEQRPYIGLDPSIDDWLLGYGSQDPGGPTVLQADIIYAGFLPGSFFDTIYSVPVAAFAATFYWVDENGAPTDINNDHFLDSAQSEIYFNASMGDPADPAYHQYRFWSIGPPGNDLESIALHETGHSLGLYHFAYPPRAVMNPFYLGVLHDLQPIDQAGICTVYGSWPQR